MIDEKAKKYADEIAGNDDYLKIYHAYIDGQAEGRFEETERKDMKSIIMGVLVGLVFWMIVIAMYMIISGNDFTIKHS